MINMVSRHFLARHAVVDTRCPEQARQEIARIFTPHFLSPRHPSRFHALLRSLRQDFYSLTLIRYGSEVEIDPGELSRCFLLLFCLVGTGNIRCGKETVLLFPGQTAAILSPTLATRIQWSEDCEALAVLLEREALERHWGLMIDRPISTIEFAAAIDISSAAGRLLVNHIRLMFESLESGDSSIHYRQRLAECLMQLVLTSLAHDQRSLLERPSPLGQLTAIDRAEDWIRANIARPFSVAEIATASGATSLRSLQNTLRRERATTLTEIVEAIRLEAFRASLLNIHEPRSVTECALSVGLGHLGRAAMAYQKRYGESPSQTLRCRR